MHRSRRRSSAGLVPRPPLPRPDRGNRGVQHDVATADKVARTGSADEKVRDTPPAGAWNDTTHD